MNNLNMTSGIEVRTIGDSRGYLWKIIIDKDRGIGKIEKVSGINENAGCKPSGIDGSMYSLNPGSDVSETMQDLTSRIESRFEAA